MSDDRELEEIRKRRLQELQRQALERQAMEEQQEAERKAAEKERLEILRKLLTPEALQRLSNVRLVRPELAENVENQIIYLAQSGRLTRQITDAEVKALLAKLSEKREIRIERR
ncbi:MAG: DNA-binding protein [Thermoplasmatales archaeon]|jgi:DNA-binding TFAR19-related protein